MKRIQNSWLVTGTAALSLCLAACSSKQSEDNSAGGGTGNSTSSSGGAASSTGGKSSAATTKPATGGKSSTDTSSTQPAANTGGSPQVGVGGSTSFDPTTYCNGIFKNKSCGQTSLAADVRVVNMLIVLDESGSMKDSPTTGGASKWSIMQQALSKVLTEQKDNINFGLELFPYGGDPTSTNVTDQCMVPSDGNSAVEVGIGSEGSGSATVNKILSTVAAQTPNGGTPTADALNRAYDYFKNGDGRALPGTRWVLLATDGGPNCNQANTCDATRCTQNLDGSCPSGNCCSGNYGYICLDDQATTSAIQKLFLLGVKTFVVGIPGSQAYANSLNAFAQAGGVPNTNGASGTQYYAVSAATAQDDLNAAFEDITTKLVKTCDIELSAPPTVQPDQVNVAVDCSLIPALPAGTSPDAGNANGFYIDYGDPATQTPAHLILVGSACSSIQSAGASHVDVIAGCPGIN